ncbi:MAG: hypothetical protein ABW250_01000 [Pyrinomonadaceae bacterium]
MSNSFPLGSIPPFTAWEGETLKFNVRSGLGDPVKFTKRATPSPKGKMTLDEKTGAFTYTPASEDRDDIAVWFWARKGEKYEKQKVVITPHPRLPPEFKVIRHEANPPKPSEFTTFVEQPDAAPSIFNNTADYKDESKAKVRTSQVTISGVDLVLESESKTYPLFERLRGRTNLRRLTLCADTVTVRNELKLPGTEVHIYARVLRFDEKGAINTTPLSVAARADERDEALRGQKGGDVYLYVQKLETSVAGNRIITKGGNGQPAREGKVGEAGHVVKEWDGKGSVKEMVVYTGDMDYSGDIREKASDYKPLFAEKFAKVPWQDVPGYLEAGTWGTKDWPSDGHPPKKLPGHPGHGGDGGSVFTALADQLKNRVDLGAGDSGGKADNVPASAAGMPARSCHVKVYYKVWLVRPFEDPRPGESATVRRDGVNISEKREVKPGPGATAPGVNSNTPAAKPGAVRALENAGPGHWIHPATVRAILAYGHDAALSGYSADARNMLASYRDAVEAAGLHTKGGLEWSGLHGEVASLVERIDGPYDYFGNPAGWVPKLSLESNLKLYQDEIESSIRTMFLAYWMENIQRDKTSAADSLRAALNRLEEEGKKAAEDYNAAIAKLTDLDKRLEPLKAEIDAFYVELKKQEAEMEKAVKGDLQMEHFLRSTGKLLGGVMQLIPVGQPVLGAFGKGLTALSDIDLEKPFDTVPEVLGAFSDVAQKKLLPKAKTLYDKFKSYLDEDAPEEKPKPKPEKEPKEKDDEDDKFDKEVAKKKLDAKVKTYMDEQKEAKSQAVKSFKGFAVPESEVKERLARVISECPQYQSLVKQLEPLNAKKAAYMQETLAAIQTMDEATATILHGQLARIEMRAQLNKNLEELSPEVFQYAREIGQRARARLLKYQYYLLKSYQFLMIEDLPTLDFRAQKMFDAFTKYLPGNTKLKPNDPDYLPPSVQGDLTEKHYQRLSAVFEDQLRDVIGTIIDYYVSNPPKYDGKFGLELSDAQLETLNAHGRLDIDLMRMGYHDFDREDIRIISIEAEHVELANPPTEGLVNIGLTYRHEGVSRLRRGGQLYLFRSGRYRVSADGRVDGGYRDDKTYWGTDVTYRARTQAPQITHRKPDEVEKWLIKHLLGEKDTRDTSPLTSYRPSAWAGLTVTHSATPSRAAGKLKRLELSVTYASHNLDDKLGTVFVRVSTDVQPLVSCSAVDVNGLADGQGTFLRTFDTTKTARVTVRAPEYYGQRKFLGWLIDEKPLSERVGRVNPGALWWLGEMGGYLVDPGKVHSSPSLELDLGKQSSYTVEPFYTPLSYTPIDDKGEEWPPCPAGWGFEDWVLTNGSQSTVKIDKLDWLPWRGGKGYAPTVGEPQGNNYVKLSFERLVLAPGESSKISVCANPRVELVDDFQYMFISEGGHAVFFGRSGKISGVFKWVSGAWKDASAASDIDRENRTVTFKQG